MRITVMDNAREIGKAVGRMFVDAINEKPDITLGLATGASPIPTYKYICKACESGKVSLKNVSTYNLDEYVNLPRSDKNSYYSFMHEQLFDRTDIKEKNIHFLNGNARDTEKECRKYDEMLEKAHIDIQLLGVGRNGHIGFNEPSICFSKGSFKVKLTQSTINANKKYFSENPMPTEALTMGVGSIMKAKKIVLIATGIEKADAIAALVNGDVTPVCPVSILQFHHDVEIFLDKAAASLL
ncbi:MAG: glucosamine-6-phosphate deaminase [Ruminococcaceae bacterium]|nr:glucosamine-6-phosphate deaminase [Oscillospiraceae bacterium]